MDDPRKPLRSRVLAVPRLRAKYLEYVRTIAEHSLDWKNLGPLVAQYRELIRNEVEADTRKLSSLAAFEAATADGAEAGSVPGRRQRPTLRSFADQRRRYLLGYKDPQAATGPTKSEPERSPDKDEGHGR
jgi:hypothetical protein